jgi:hypothetical protein
VACQNIHCDSWSKTQWIKYFYWTAAHRVIPQPTEQSWEVSLLSVGTADSFYGTSTTEATQLHLGLRYGISGGLHLLLIGLIGLVARHRGHFSLAFEHWHGVARPHDVPFGVGHTGQNVLVLTGKHYVPLFHTSQCSLIPILLCRSAFMKRCIQLSYNLHEGYMNPNRYWKTTESVSHKRSFSHLKNIAACKMFYCLLWMFPFHSVRIMLFIQAPCSFSFDTNVQFQNRQTFPLHV